MGTNTLTARVDGNKIPANDHNELVQALLIDLVPRNNSRAPQDIIGALGTSALRWLRAYVSEYYVGNAANNLRIYEGAAGELWIENGLNNRVKIRSGIIEIWINNVLKGSFDSNGLEGALIKAQSVSNDSIASDKRFISGSVLVQSDLDTNDTLSSLVLGVRNGYKYSINITMKNTAGADTAGWPVLLTANAVLLNNFGGFATGATGETSQTLTWIYTATTTANITFRWYVPSAGGAQGVNGGLAWIEEI